MPPEPSILTGSSETPRRGEVWRAQTGGKRHALVIVSVNSRNQSNRVGSILAVPFGSYGAPGPTSIRMEPGQTGLPEPNFLKVHFISVVLKSDLIERLPRRMSEAQMRTIIAMINRAIDPDAPYEEQLAASD